MAVLRKRYETIEVVGRGGEGEVLRAIDQMHSRPVALKRRRLAPGEDREQLLSEARVLLGLTPNPGLPLVRDDFFERDSYYLVMDWVDGTSLSTLLTERGAPGLPLMSVLRYLDDVSATLEHLHRHSPPVVHADVKPANMILTNEGRVVLVDFGIARRGRDPGAVAAGTPGYMAPEVARGEMPSPAADVFGLAASAYALLTGGPPAGIPEWDALPDRAAGTVSRAIRAALAFDPERRPSSTRELVEHLRMWLESDLPSGAVTLLLASVAEMHRLWEAYPEQTARAMARHDALLGAAAEAYHGRLLTGAGRDSVVAFGRSGDAVACALEVQRSFASERWEPVTPVMLRVAIHSEPITNGTRAAYRPAIDRGERLLELVHPGQVILSGAAADLAHGALPDGASLRDLGSHRPPGLTRPERLFQLVHPEIAGEFPPLGATAPRHNLPTPASSFVGRDAEVSSLRDAVRRSRLLTLTGVGGVGKTRLALRVAEESLAAFSGGIWLVELGSINEEALVAAQVASALGVREEQGRPILDLVTDRLRPEPSLLVLDNCEHLVGACASVVGALLASCSELVVLATSREPLGITGEQVWPVPTLPLPDSGDTVSPEGLLGSEAVALFVDRASNARPGFRLDSANAAAVVQICRHLDGIPLALELAAARVKVLSVEQISQRLDDRFRLLTTSARTALPRQQTLRAAVEWSHDLLTEPERVLFRRLAVFAGGFALEAAEDVCADETSLDPVDVLDLLAGLVDKSLVVADETLGDIRYRMLETIREYARERLAEQSEEAAARDRHLAWARSLAERAEPAWFGPEQGAWLVRLETEHENIRAAIDHGVANAGSDVIRLCAAIWRFWHVHGHLSEGRGRLAAALALDSGESADRADLLNGAGRLAQDQGDYPAAQGWYEQALELRRQTNDVEGVAGMLNNLGMLAALRGDYESGQSLFEESLEIRRSLDDATAVAVTLGNLGELARRMGKTAPARALFQESLEIRRKLGDAFGAAVCLGNLGEVALADGDTEGALKMFQESLELTQGLGDKEGIAIALHGLGAVAHARGDVAGAGQRFGESLALRVELGDRQGVVECLERVAALASAKGNAESAARLIGACETAREWLGSPLPPAERSAYEREVAVARKALGLKEFEQSRSRGRALTLDQAVGEGESIIGSRAT